MPKQPHKEFLRGLADSCRLNAEFAEAKHAALKAESEVMAGFGRTGDYHSLTYHAAGQAGAAQAYRDLQKQIEEHLNPKEEE